MRNVLLVFAFILLLLKNPFSSYAFQKKPKTKTVKAYNKKGGKHVEIYHRSSKTKKK